MSGIISGLVFGGGVAKSTSTEINVEDLEPYDPAHVAPDGFLGYRANSYISFVNAGSSDPQFQTEAIYRSNIDIVQGISPEDDQVNWIFLGQSTIIPSSGLARITVSDISALKALEGYEHGHGVFVKNTSSLYEFDINNETGEKPDDGGVGSWINIKQLSIHRPNSLGITISVDSQTTIIDLSATEVQTLDISDGVTTHTLSLSNLSSTERSNTIVIDNRDNLSGLIVTIDDQSASIDIYAADNDFPGIFPQMEVVAGSRWEINYEPRGASSVMMSFIPASKIN